MSLFERLGRRREITIDELLESLSSEDRNNLLLLADRLEKETARQDFFGGIWIVGGVLKKIGKRKDIDASVLIRRLVESETGADKTRKRFSNLESVVKSAFTAEDGVGIGEVIRPYKDPEFDNESILAHDGSIRLNPAYGTTIELINNSSDDELSAMTRSNEPFSLLRLFHKK